MVHWWEEVNCRFWYASSCQRKKWDTMKYKLLTEGATIPDCRPPWSWPDAGGRALPNISAFTHRPSVVSFAVIGMSRAINRYRLTNGPSLDVGRVRNTAFPRIPSNLCVWRWRYRSILPTPIAPWGGAKMRTVMACCGSVCLKVVIWDWYRGGAFRLRERCNAKPRK